MNTGQNAGDETPSPISRTTILILGWILVGMSIQSTGLAQVVTLLYGCYGLIAYIALEYDATIRKRTRGGPSPPKTGSQTILCRRWRSTPRGGSGAEHLVV